MIVRAATRDDSDAIAALHAASWRSTYRHILSVDYLDHHVIDDRQDLWAARFAKFQSGQHHVAVAVDEGQPNPALDYAPLAGFVCVLLDEEPDVGALLDNLHVAPDRHGQRIGRRLMAEAAHWIALRQPQWAMHLWVYEKNVKSVGFYHSIGGTQADSREIVTPAGNRATVLRLDWASPAALARSLDASLERRPA